MVRPRRSTIVAASWLGCPTTRTSSAGGAIKRRPARHRSPVATNEMFELFDNELLITDNAFHHVANRKYTNQSFTLEHRRWRTALAVITAIHSSTDWSGRAQITLVDIMPRLEFLDVLPFKTIRARNAVR